MQTDTGSPRALIVVLATLALDGCGISPRSAVFGQSALAGLGRWSAEGGASLGLSYRRDTSPTKTEADGSEVTSPATQVALGAFEANALLGFSDRLALNVHLSPAGIQPGLKIALLRRWLSLSVLPEVGLGYMLYRDEQETRKDGTTSTETDYDIPWFGLLIGSKVIASTPFGLYGGLGYDFHYENIDSRILGGERTKTERMSHLLGFALGYEFRLAYLRLRPELAFVVAPAMSITTREEGARVTRDGGTSVLIFPNLTFAVAGERAAAK